MVALVVVGKLVMWTLVVWMFRHPVPHRAARGGGTDPDRRVLLHPRSGCPPGRSRGTEDVYNATLATALITILINAVLVRYVPGWIGACAPASRGRPRARARRGRRLPPASWFAASVEWAARWQRRSRPSSTRYVAIEPDPDIVKGLRARGITGSSATPPQHAVLAAATPGRRGWPWSWPSGDATALRLAVRQAADA